MRLGVGVAFTGMQAGPVLAGGPYPSRPPDESQSLRSLSVPVRGPSCATLVCHPNLSRKLDFHCGTYGKEAAGFKFLHYVPVRLSDSSARPLPASSPPSKSLPAEPGPCALFLAEWPTAICRCQCGPGAVGRWCPQPQPEREYVLSPSAFLRVQPPPFRTRPVVLIGPWRPVVCAFVSRPGHTAHCAEIRLADYILRLRLSLLNAAGRVPSGRSSRWIPGSLRALSVKSFGDACIDTGRSMPASPARSAP